jgi:DNA-binding GntR family transcriptional regulator
LSNIREAIEEKEVIGKRSILTEEKLCFLFKVDRFTLKGALKDAGIDTDEFLRHIR